MCLLGLEKIMATYKMDEFLFDNEIDSIGAKYSLRRISNEEMKDYSDRLYYQSKRPISQHISDIGFYLNNAVGLLETAIFKIDLKLDQSGQPIYPYAFIKIDSYFLHIIEDYFEDKIISIPYREFDTFDDLILEINSYGILDCSTIHNVDTSIHKDTYSLKIQTNLTFGTYQYVNTSLIDLGKSNIFEVFYDNQVFYNEVDSFEKVREGGDYYMDKLNGKIYLHKSNFDRSGTVEYNCASFPYYVMKQPLKINLGTDDSFLHLVKDEIEEKSGEKKRCHVNSKGWRFYNSLLNSSPTYWGH